MWSTWRGSSKSHFACFERSSRTLWASWNTRAFMTSPCSQKLTHPSYEIKKIYEVTLDKPVSKADMETIAAGIELEDGFIAADAVSYLSNTSKNVIGIEIHSGRNRIVRRIFEYLGYDVRQLDRVMFAGLTKKNVDRGKWRFLSEKEVRLLKFLNASFTRKSSH